MRKAVKWSLVLSALVFIAVAAYCGLRFGLNVDVLDRSGWSDKDGIVRYLDYWGRPLQQWQRLGENVYYFMPENGEIATGWQQIDSDKYFFEQTGARASGWKEIDNKQYYFSDDGKMVTGWCSIGSETYYFGSDGSMYTDWQTIGGEKYCFSKLGILLTGWQVIEGERHCFAEDGKPLVGWQNVNKETYCFDESGKVFTGWQLLDGKRYYFADGGCMRTGWVPIGGVRYFFDTDGVNVVGWHQDPFGKYYFDSEGCCQTGWQEIADKQYYFGENGKMVSGWLTLGQDRYYFREDGSMAVGEVVIDGVSNFFASSGKYVLLVNYEVPVPEDFVLDLVSLGDYKVDRSARDALETMTQACQNAGYSCRINNSYRSEATQQYLRDKKVNTYMDSGMSYADAYRQMEKEVLLAGHSEHHTGLAVDYSGSAAAYAWLALHCTDYGFILRYPTECTSHTGIIYEPWHFRYVGKELAKELKELDMCMEEYMDWLTQNA